MAVKITNISAKCLVFSSLFLIFLISLSVAEATSDEEFTVETTTTDNKFVAEGKLGNEIVSAAVKEKFRDSMEEKIFSEDDER